MSATERPVFNDRYEIHSRIGRGGMADVFLARDRLLDRPVAVKVLFPEYATDPSFVERFRREAQSAANLNHPNIVGVYDWGRQSGTYFIVMEYVNGRTLADLVKADGPLPAQRATDIAFDVGGALGFAHRNGVVHRDVKPGNILVAPTGAVKVADFGIARALNSSTEADLTQAGAVMGTATYFSPEQAQGANPDPRSDLYSLGIVMYEMVAGKPPFSGGNPVAIAYRQVHDTPQPLSELRPDVPRGYEAITMKLLAKSPANRYATADELRADLRRFREGQQPVALTPTTGTELTTMNPSAAATQVIGAAAVAAPRTEVVRAQPVPVAAAPTLVQPSQVISPRPPSAYGDDPYYEGRRRPGWVVPVTLLLIAALIGGGVLYWRNLNKKTPTPAATIALIDVKGRTVDEARDLLQKIGLFADPEARKTDGAPAGQVWDQAPLPNTPVDKGSHVKIFYNPAPDTFPVPLVIGKTQDEAVAALGNAGFNFTVTTEPSDNDPAGKVLKQDPIPQAPLIKGGTVKLTVSAGKPQVEIPNVLNEDAIPAANLLGAKGFATDTAEETSDTVPAGKVIRTEPAVNTAVEKGSKVKLIISSGAPPVVVPDFVGLTRDVALQKIQELQLFQGVPTDCPSSDAGQVGKVVSQAPAAGVKVPKSSAVTVCIGQALPTTTTAPTTTLPPTTTTVKATTTTIKPPTP